MIAWRARHRRALMAALAFALALLTASVGEAQGSLGPIVFALGEDDVEPVGAGERFPAGTREIYAFFTFEDLAASDVVSGVWYFGEHALMSQATTLAEVLGPVNTERVPKGKLFFALVLEDGAQPGEYRLELSLNVQPAQTARFTIDSAATTGAVDAAAMPLTCAMRGHEIEGDAGTVAVGVCPAGCSPSMIWGTGTYTSDSPLCAAALHLGIIPPAGGPIEITILPGQAQYEGTTRNGVKSMSYGAYSRSYALAAPAGEASSDGTPSPGVEAEGTSPGPRAQPGTFYAPGVAAEIAEGDTVSALFHYPEPLATPHLVFAYRDMLPGPIWGWRISEEGATVAHQSDLVWEFEGTGMHALPLGVALEEGTYDIDLVIGGNVVASDAVSVGAPVTAPDRVLASDDFDDAQSGWGTTHTGDITVEYRNGALALTIHRAQLPGLSLHERVLDDAVMEVEATTLAGPEDNALGIVARYQDENNFYAFLVSADGYSSILHFEDGRQVWDRPWHFDDTGGIGMGSAPNTLRVLADGSTLRFYVNGRFHGAVHDAKWPTGRAGVFAASLDLPGVQTGFDRWRAWALPEGSDASAP